MWYNRDACRRHGGAAGNEVTTASEKPHVQALHEAAGADTTTAAKAACQAVGGSGDCVCWDSHTRGAHVAIRSCGSLGGGRGGEGSSLAPRAPHPSPLPPTAKKSDCGNKEENEDDVQGIPKGTVTRSSEKSDVQVNPKGTITISSQQDDVHVISKGTETSSPRKVDSYRPRNGPWFEIGQE